MATVVAPPPHLPGMKLGHRLGGGGFADVYLYEQEALARKVAVKVLREHASTLEVQRQFRAESMLMAALSDHQNIVTIYDAAIAPDGRPFLVMAYCPGRNLSERYKSGPLPVTEVLSIGIQLAGAVETAHRQQILHRDIKPANVLTTASGRPALTDFGISVSIVTSAGPGGGGPVGMSIPWSPPEMLADEPTGDRRADVYSLAATLYTLLAGRSPYELPGRSNDQMDLVHRIDSVTLTPTGRPDVPASLERVLARAMAKNPEARYPGALEFARTLQQLETELHLPVTPVDILAEDPQAAQDELGPADDGRTHIRHLLTIHPQAPTGSAARADSSMLDVGPDRTQLRGRSAAGEVVAEHTQVRGAVGARPYLQPGYLEPPKAAADTQIRSVPVGVEDQEAAPTRSRRPMLIGIGVAIALVAVVGAVLALKGTAPASAPAASASPTSSSVPSLSDDLVPIPTQLAGKVQGADVVFSWADPAPKAGDTYRWTRTDVAGTPEGVYTDKPTATVLGAARACIQVVLIRADSTVSEPGGPICFPES